MNRRKLLSFLPLSALGIVSTAKAEVSRLAHPLTGYPMTIEEWRDKAMVYREAVERLIAEKESVWVEMTCQSLGYVGEMPGPTRYAPWVRDPSSDIPPCGQKFKVLRIATTPHCPKCGYAQDISRDGLREKFFGVPC